MDLITLEELNKEFFRSKPRPLGILRRWCRNKVLPARKIGGEWYVDRDKFIENPVHEAPPSAGPNRTDMVVKRLVDIARERGRH